MTVSVCDASLLASADDVFGWLSVLLYVDCDPTSNSPEKIVIKSIESPTFKRIERCVVGCVRVSTSPIQTND